MRRLTNPSGTSPSSTPHPCYANHMSSPSLRRFTLQGQTGVTSPTPAPKHRTHSSHDDLRPRSSVIRSSAPDAPSSNGSADQRGRCWLVGAGPGPADLLTVRAVESIKSAEVIVYDDLGAQDALKYARADAELIYVGKRGGRPSIKQNEINAILVEHCCKGRNVVRLKGGCPSVFSRGSSEASALANVGVDVEFVPGISSALSAPLLAGFPLTDTVLGSGFMVLSGQNVDDMDWASAHNTVPTVVLLMAGKKLSKIVSAMRSGGWKGATPVAVIRSAGGSEEGGLAQREWWSRLDDVIGDTEGEVLSPCVVVVGKVAGLQATWNEAKGRARQ